MNGWPDKGANHMPYYLVVGGGGGGYNNAS